MKQLARLFMRWLIIVLLVLDTILFFAITAKCQSVHQQHVDLVDLEDKVGFMSVIFLSRDDNLIYWKRETKHEVILSSFAYGKNTVIDGKLDGKLCILYCREHLFAYFITHCK